MASPTPQTIFTRDILGNYVCNTFAEAVNSGPFDVVIIGGGTFGLTIAQNLYFRSKKFDRAPGGVPTDAAFKPPNFRILVLEAGPFTIPEHVQDIPSLGLGAPGPVADVQPSPLPNANTPLPATRQGLVQAGLEPPPRSYYEVWGLPWNSPVRFGGLAYCLGGRSLYWGGWSPHYLDSEMHVTPAGQITADTLWPEVVVEDLKARWFEEAEDQTGVTTSNDYINGALHDHFRQQLFQIYAGIPGAVPLAEIRPAASRFPGPRLQAQIAAGGPAFVESTKLDAPLAVQIETRPGFFPFNKFSSVPLAITAARDAYGESPGDDRLKRLMVVPNCHVKGLRTRTYTLATGASVREVDGIDTTSGFLDLSGVIAGNANRRPVVVLAMGAVESARLALLSAGAVPNAALIGGNLMVHLRKNVAFTVPLPPGLNLNGQELTALLLRCRTSLANGTTPAHFHCQITASAVPQGSGKGAAEALLYQSVPDLDHVRIFAETNPGELDVVIRAVGEMIPNPQNSVTVPQQPADGDEFGVPRATVNVTRSALDDELMTRIDQVIAHVAQKLFGAQLQTPPANVPPDGLGTTYHESGMLRMGDDPARSVVNPDGQFHYVTNLYAGDAAVLPTCGSANPVMNGVALRRRLGRRLVPEGDGARPQRGFFQPQTPAAAPALGTVIQLFDGQTLKNWRMAGRGTFHVIDGALQSVPSFDLGLLWCTIPMPETYRLELEFFVRTPQTNSGVFVRFRNPDSFNDYNVAWSAVRTGFEIQIDNSGAPDGWLKHRTGAVYAVNYPNDPNQSPGAPPATAGDFVNPQPAQVLAWNRLAVEVNGDVFAVTLNGVQTAQYTNPDPTRGRFGAEPTFVGLQSYSNYSYTTAFRGVRVTVL